MWYQYPVRGDAVRAMRTALCKEKHKPDCQGINKVAVTIGMPKPDTVQSKISFKNHHKQLKAPYIIYADFKRAIPNIERPALDAAKSGTQQTARHAACSYSYMMVRSDWQTQPPQLYRGPDAAKLFLAVL